METLCRSSTVPHTLSHSARPEPLAGQAGGRGSGTLDGTPYGDLGVGALSPKGNTRASLWQQRAGEYDTALAICVPSDVLQSRSCMVGAPYSNSTRRLSGASTGVPARRPINCLPPAAVLVCCAPLPHSLGSSVCNDFAGRPAVVSLSPLLGKRSLRLRIDPAVTT